MEIGDVKMIFGSPIRMEHPIGEAKLRKKVMDLPNDCEEWWIEYLNNPGREYIALIKKTDNGQ